jgi:hypothetical protein
MTSRTAGSRSIALMAALCSAVFPAAGATRADVNIVFPADAGVANVRELGARGDGVHDDTGVIEKAMAAANDRLGTVYLPDGVYLVTRPLVQNLRWAFLQGQSRRGTILKLKDRAEGYGDADKGRIMISNVHTGPDAWGSVGAKPAAGHYNMSFNGFIRDLTIDTGKGNPGAIALHYGMFGGNNTMLRESNWQNTIVVPRPKDQDRCFFMSTEERK